MYRVGLGDAAEAQSFHLSRNVPAVSSSGGSRNSAEDRAQTGQPQDADQSVIIQRIRSDAIRKQVTPIFASLGSAMAVVASRYSVQELAAIQDDLERTIQALRDETAKLTHGGEMSPPSA